jgi:hypothetical protein
MLIRSSRACKLQYVLQEAREFSPSGVPQPQQQPQQTPMMVPMQPQFYPQYAYPGQYAAPMMYFPQQGGYPVYPNYGYPDPNNYGYMQQQQQQSMRPQNNNAYAGRRNTGPRNAGYYGNNSGAPNGQSNDGSFDQNSSTQEVPTEASSGDSATDATATDSAASSASDSNVSAGASTEQKGSSEVTASASVQEAGASESAAATVQFGDTAPVAISADDSVACASQTGVKTKSIPSSSSTNALDEASTSNLDRAVSGIKGLKVKDDYESALNRSESTDKEKPVTPVAGGEWSRKKIEKVEKVESTKSVSNPVEEDTWKRDGSAAFDKNDGVTRYTKLELMQMNTLKKMPPVEIRNMYPHHSKTERFPKIPKGWKQLVLLEDSTPHEDEARIFGGDKVFKFDAAKHSNADDPEVIIRKATLILNQLSETNFERLSSDFMAVGIDKHELMGRVVDMLVLKAQIDESFGGMYANLAKKLSTTWSTNKGSDAPEAADESSEAPDLGETFRNRLLHRAKEEFEIDRAAAVAAIRNNTDITVEDREEKEIKLKKRYNGMMRFVGELYGVELLKSRVIEECINSLFRSKTEEDLVCLNKLMQTVGAKYDVKKSNKAHLDKLFADMDDLINNHASSRVRFLMGDLKLLRQDGWKMRGAEPEKPPSGSQSGASTGGSNKGFTPKTSSASNAAPRFGGGGGSQDARRLGGGGSGANTPTTPAADEWSTVGGAKKSGKAPSGPVTNGAATPTSNGAAASGKLTTKFSALLVPEKPKRGNSSSSGEKSPKREPKNPGGSSTRATSAPASVPEKDTTESSEPSGTPKLELAIPTEAPAPAVALVGVEGNVDKDTLKKTRAAFDEYLASNDANDAIADISALVHPNGMGEVFKVSLFCSTAFLLCQFKS